MNEQRRPANDDKTKHCNDKRSRNQRVWLKAHHNTKEATRTYNVQQTNEKQTNESAEHTRLTTGEQTLQINEPNK